VDVRTPEHHQSIVFREKSRIIELARPRHSFEIRPIDGGKFVHDSNTVVVMVAMVATVQIAQLSSPTQQQWRPFFPNGIAHAPGHKVTMMHNITLIPEKILPEIPPQLTVNVNQVSKSCLPCN
jgi:hypothetical protein